MHVLTVTANPPGNVRTKGAQVKSLITGAPSLFLAVTRILSVTDFAISA